MPAPATSPEADALASPGSWRPEEVAAYLATGVRPATMRQVMARWPHPNDYEAQHRRQPPTDTTTWPAPVPALPQTPRGQWIVLAGLPDYPTHLAGTQAPPLVLFGRGNLDALARPGLGIVGTRSMTAYGRAVIDTAVRSAATGEHTVISGLARGCDRHAHEQALAAGIPTVAVLATGPDITYPHEHHELAEQIVAAGGAVVSEQPFGTGTDTAPSRTPAPLAARLQARNRIIAGLSSTLVLAEAAGASGAMGTVWSMLTMGRPVVVALPKATAGDLPGAIGPRALAHAAPRTADRLRAMGAPAAVARTWSDQPGPLASATARDRDELDTIVTTFLAIGCH